MSASAQKPVSGLEDSELMALVSLGLPDAFGELYDRFGERAYRVAISVCRDGGRAEDAVQDAFLSIWRTRSAFNPHKGTVAAWLLSSVRYRAIDLVRRNGRDAAAPEVQLEITPAPGDIAETAIQRDVAERLRASLATLPEAQQEVIVLAYYGGLSHAEIAAQLGLPPGTVKGRMRLGLQKLQHQCGEDFGGSRTV